MPRKTIRKAIPASRRYYPQWKGFVEGYVTNFLHKNYWRVAAYMEYSDCVQEAYLQFLKVKRKYGRLDSPKHFMALYNTTWMNAFNKMSNSVTKRRVELNRIDRHSQWADCESGYSDREDEYYAELLVGDLDSDGMLAVMIEQAPQEVKQVLDLFLNAPVEVLDMFAAGWRKRGKYSEFGNKHLCEILSLPEQTDVVGIVSKYFAPIQI